MDDNYTHISLVADRSGSMAAVQSDAEGAINAFIDGQKDVEGRCSFLLAEFDAPWPYKRTDDEDDWYHVVHDGDLADCPRYRLVPRGNTALLDAVGQAIVRTGERLSAIDEDARPSRVVFVIQTDGQENSSKDWTWDKVSEAIKHQAEAYNWQFVFLGMGADAWDQGSRMGVANVIRSAGTGVAHGHTHSVMDAYVTSYRGGQTVSMASAGGTTVDAQGRVFNAAGDELDPATGKPIAHDHTHPV